MTPLKPGTARRLGIVHLVPPEEPYALIALAFPAPEGATAWRCLYGHCSARSYYFLNRASAETAAEEHVRRDHPSHLPERVRSTTAAAWACPTRTTPGTTTWSNCDQPTVELAGPTP